MESLHSQVYQFGKLFQVCKATVEELHTKSSELGSKSIISASICFAINRLCAWSLR